MAGPALPILHLCLFPHHHLPLSLSDLTVTGRFNLSIYPLFTFPSGPACYCSRFHLLHLIPHLHKLTPLHSSSLSLTDLSQILTYSHIFLSVFTTLLSHLVPIRPHLLSLSQGPGLSLSRLLPSSGPIHINLLPLTSPRSSLTYTHRFSHSLPSFLPYYPPQTPIGPHPLFIPIGPAYHCGRSRLPLPSSPLCISLLPLTDPHGSSSYNVTPKTYMRTAPPC